MMHVCLYTSLECKWVYTSSFIVIIVIARQTDDIIVGMKQEQSTTNYKLSSSHQSVSLLVENGFCSLQMYFYLFYMKVIK